MPRTPHRTTRVAQPKGPENLEAALELANARALHAGRPTLAIRFLLNAYDHTDGKYKYVRGGGWAIELQTYGPGDGAKIARRVEKAMADMQRALLAGG